MLYLYALPTMHSLTAVDALQHSRCTVLYFTAPTARPDALLEAAATVTGAGHTSSHVCPCKVSAPATNTKSIAGGMALLATPEGR